jgi:hypothetical protein
VYHVHYVKGALRFIHVMHVKRKKSDVAPTSLVDETSRTYHVNSLLKPSNEGSCTCKGAMVILHGISEKKREFSITRKISDYSPLGFEPANLDIAGESFFNYSTGSGYIVNMAYFV